MLQNEENVMIKALNEINKWNHSIARKAPVFPSTMILNESWFIRCLFEKWMNIEALKGLPFYESDCIKGIDRFKTLKFFSEGQLYTPFSKKKGRPHEANTHVDGIIGDFSIRNKTRSGVNFNKDFKFIAVLEAKMSSNISKSVRYSQNYNQISRTIACIIESIIRSRRHEINIGYEVHFSILFPDGHKNAKDIEDALDKGNIRTQIINRISEFSAPVWENEKWEEILNKIDLHSIYWETILQEIDDEDLLNFYYSCKTANR